LTLGLIVGACGGEEASEDRAKSPLEQTCDDLFNGDPAIMDQLGALIYKYSEAGEQLPNEFELSPIDQLDPNPHQEVAKLSAENERIASQLEPFDDEFSANRKVPAQIAEVIREFKAFLELVAMANTADDMATALTPAIPTMDQLRDRCGLSPM
jgi:hypothetical protein